MVLSATVSVAQTTPLFSAVSPSGHRINYQWNYDDSYYRNGYPEYNSVMVWQSNYVMFDTQRYRSGDTTLHGAVVIPDSVTYGNKTYAVTRIHSFMAPYITDITIPNTVTKIDEDALSNCGFSTLTIPENVTSFGGGIAMDCDSLTTVYYNAKHASLPSGYGGRLFSWTVRNIVFGESVEEIPHHICKSQDSLRTVTILGNVKKIGEYAFAYCRKLKSVTIPASVEQIGTYAFVSCSNLDTVYYNATYCTTRYRDIWEDPFYLTNIKQLVIGENVQQIHLYMFDTVQTAICKAQVAPIVDNLVNNSRGFLTVVNGGKLFTGTGTQVIVPCGHTESYQSISEWSRNTISDDCVTVDTKSNDANLGIAVGGQICSPYTPLTLYALPFAGNTFVGWTDGNTDNPRDVISLTENVSFTAIFSTKDTVTLHDTTIIVDTLTEYVPVHDTTYIDVHDTTYVDVPYAVHDTTIVVDILTLTEYVPVHDTTYIDVHDTTYVDVPYAVHDTLTLTEYIPVHDTTIVVDTLTLTEYVPVHDTTYIDVHDTTYIDVPYAVHDTTVVVDTLTLTEYVPVYDTTYIDVHDTAYIDVHDTTYIDVPYAVHDTTVVVDTLTLTEYVPVNDTTYIDVHDTTYIDVPYAVHDTTVVVDTLTNIVMDTVNNYIYDTIMTRDTLYLFDTIWFHDTVFVHDTIYIGDSAGIDDVEYPQIKVYGSNGYVVIEGALNRKVRLYDVSGRNLKNTISRFDRMTLDVPATGTYMIVVDNLPPKKVVIVK